MTIEIREEAGVRSLHFGSDWVQGAMRIARPWSLELEYTREMMASLLFRYDSDWPRNVLLIGLGAASLTKFLYRYRPNSKLTVVEIDPDVVTAARQFFKLPDDSRRIDIQIADGTDFMVASKKRFDLILVDGYDANARTGRLSSLPFYIDCRARLSSDGLIAINLHSRRKDFSKNIDRIEEAFDSRTLVLPSCDSGNVIAFASAGEPMDFTFSELRLLARQIKADTTLNLLSVLGRLEQRYGCPDGRLSI